MQTIYFSPSACCTGSTSAPSQLLARGRVDCRPLPPGRSGKHQPIGGPTLARRPATRSGALFGGVQYEIDSTAIATANANISNEEVASRGGLSFTYADSTPAGAPGAN
ncbi:MAG: hypothetical protein IPM82_32670 [Saprospiraceae bacterium]|nr:hypothetical protein [Saprospiraceae bacterium]